MAIAIARWPFVMWRRLPLLVMYDYTRMTAEEIAQIPKLTGGIVKDYTTGGQFR